MLKLHRPSRKESSRTESNQQNPSTMELRGPAQGARSMRGFPWMTSQLCSRRRGFPWVTSQLCSGRRGFPRMASQLCSRRRGFPWMTSQLCSRRRGFPWMTSQLCSRRRSFPWVTSQLCSRRRGFPWMTSQLCSRRRGLLTDSMAAQSVTEMSGLLRRLRHASIFGSVFLQDAVYKGVIFYHIRSRYRELRRSDDQGIVEGSHVAAHGEDWSCSRFSEYD